MAESSFRAWRLSHGWTQQQSADALGYSLRQIKFYDQGFKQPDKTMQLAMLAISKGLTVDETNCGSFSSAA